jgi:hypothetical protein
MWFVPNVDILMRFPDNFMLFGRCFMRFYAFLPLSQTRLFQNSRGLGVGGEEVMQRHAWEG